MYMHMHMYTYRNQVAAFFGRQSLERSIKALVADGFRLKALTTALKAAGGDKAVRADLWAQVRFGCFLFRVFS